MSDNDNDYAMNENDDELIIGDDGDDSPNFITSPTNSEEIPKSTLLVPISSFLQPQIELAAKLLPNFKVCNNFNSELTFQIPTNIIPSSLQMVCGYYLSPILIEVKLTFNQASWKEPLSQFSATHPLFNQNYVGRPLIYDSIRHFFKASYIRKEEYRSSFVLFGKTSIDDFEKCPLLYLIMEIVDSFIDLQDHCCICHESLPFSVIKPSICSKKLCEVGFNEIGVGTSVVQEIRRDVSSADLLLSMFACSLNNTKYLLPKPPDELMRSADRILNTLPPMKTIAKTCRNDSDIIKNYGNESLDLLRWVLLSNRSQLIHLPEELKLKNISFPIQFMTLIASPQQEAAFQKKKKVEKHYKKSKKISERPTLFLWHGSAGDRWHSIVRNGLMNMSHKDCVNGAAYGPGIYLAKDVHTSLSYIRLVKNLYKNSELGPYFSLIALCEVIPNEKYKDFSSIATLQDEEAIIVRFVFPIISKRSYFNDYDDDYGDDYGNNNYSDDDNYYNVRAGTITSNDIPKINDVLRYLEMKNYQVK